MAEFTLSYSAYDLYKTSPLQFYYQYIAKERPTDLGCPVYGKAGTIIHDAVEHYIKTGKDVFSKRWFESGIENEKGLNGKPLSYEKYRSMMDDAIHFLTQNYDDTHSLAPEYKLELRQFDTKIKGYFDLLVKSKDGDVEIVDWKTNTTPTEELHRGQRLFYSWMVWLHTGKIPTTRWVYLDKQVFTDHFTEKDMQEFHETIRQFLEDIDRKGNIIGNYPLGDFQNPFNTYLTLCHAENERRIRESKQEIILEIKGNFVFIKCDDSRLLQGIDFATKFDLPSKYFMQESARKRGIRDTADIGTYHMFNMGLKCYPIGLHEKVRGLIKEYAEYYKKDIRVHIFDLRHRLTMEWTSGGMPERLLTDKVMRPYQDEAVMAFMDKGQGILQISTGGGKTHIGVECIRRVDGKTLWIIDRRELLSQTKEVMQSMLGIRIGEVTGDCREFDANVTIATVQTLKNLLQNPDPDIVRFFKTINFVVVDEFHKSAAESYQKVFAKLPNARWRLGLTGTAFRDDGKSPLLFAQLGEIIYSKSAKELEDEGYLMRPDITFIRLDGDSCCETYAEDYQQNIVENAVRNQIIADTVIEKDCKTLILTKIVAHGEALRAMIPGSAFIHGSLSKDAREDIMQRYRMGQIQVLIGTMSIFSEGLDFPDLGLIINAAANKGDVKSIQTLGRVLRMCSGKTKAEYIDFIDIGEWTEAHSQARMKIFRQQGYEVDVR